MRIYRLFEEARRCHFLSGVGRVICLDSDILGFILL
jgi:hypothetical protein